MYATLSPFQFKGPFLNAWKALSLVHIFFLLQLWWSPYQNTPVSAGTIGGQRWLDVDQLLVFSACPFNRIPATQPASIRKTDVHTDWIFTVFCWTGWCLAHVYQALYSHPLCQVKLAFLFSHPFLISNGTRQGCLLLSLLFFSVWNP